MLIYNCHGNGGDGGVGSGNTCRNPKYVERKKAPKVKKVKKGKNVKKRYKSVAKRKSRCYSRKSARVRGPIRSKVRRKNKILKKNAKFLEEIGLKKKNSC